MLKRRTILATAVILVLLLPFLLFKISRKITSDAARRRVVEEYLFEGDVLGEVLAAHNISPAEACSVTGELNKVFNVRRCRTGDRWEISFDEEGNFVKFVYYDGPIDFYVVAFDRKQNAYLASARKIEAEKKLRGVRGEIQSSLYESMSQAGINPEVIIQFAEVFASKIDFFTDCRTGDGFALLWESYLDKQGNTLKDARVSAASYSSEEKTYHAFYFEPQDGKDGYYDEYGKSVESAFLRAPLNYRRISSYFARRRLHPIYRIYRPHLGIDYAAAAGTPISAIGNGNVNFAGRRRDGLGITVILRHPNGYVSWYGHLSRTAKGVKKGGKVSKGQVIGYVGTTGTATGPHLDFRIQKNGKFVNFLVLKLPPSRPLASEHLPAFTEMKEALTGKMESLKDAKPVIFPN